MENSGKELELKKCREEIIRLQSENEKLYRDLFHVNEKLVDSEKLKGHFISNVTNEIINPFTSIMALARNIGQMNDGEMSKAHRMSSLIFEEAFHLDFQLKNIFAAALIEAGMDGLNLIPVNIYEITDDILLYFQSQLQKRSITITVNYSLSELKNVPFVFVSDRQKLDLILKNILSNAIKFSPEGSEISLDFELNDRVVKISVSDPGKGINEDDLQVIFDRFKQLDEKINSINTGHGLGLSIAQAYVEMLQGKISISSNSEGGILVVVLLPEQEQSNEMDTLNDFLLDSDTSF